MAMGKSPVAIAIPAGSGTRRSMGYGSLPPGQPLVHGPPWRPINPGSGSGGIREGVTAAA